ncbi:MAG: 30S ribosomal protein S17 [Candidatus Falkowbacteria bacterium]
MKKQATTTETVKPAVIQRTFTGVVTSSKMDKTIVVKVDRIAIHPKYQKRYTVSQKYKVHDEQNKYKEGAQVNFVECRPLSRDKRWRVL